ncbi:MAG TPA: hypothetical protein VN924_27120, partial [Bryobacteraceae bacterium]|nr:hypothetical protein [Bryobacteraceae bacterium]
MSHADSGTPPNAAPEGAAADAQAPPSDLVLSALQQAVGVAVNLEQDHKKAEAIGNNLINFLKSLIPDPPDTPGDDKCKNADPVIAPFCAQRRLSEATAENVFTGAEGAAGSDLHTAVSAWRLGLSQYDFETVTANSQLQVSVQAALDNYNQKVNPDSQSRNLYLYYQMVAAVDTALIAFQGAQASAGAGLAAA